VTIEAQFLTVRVTVEAQFLTVRVTVEAQFLTVRVTVEAQFLTVTRSMAQNTKPVFISHRPIRRRHRLRRDRHGLTQTFCPSDLLGQKQSSLREKKELASVRCQDCG
jgi:hypothetical protein